VPLVAIIWQSIRDPEPHSCIAVLTPSAFNATTPENLQTWTFTMLSREAVWQRHGSEVFSFSPTAWG
jgi:hypothetical protein